MDAETREALGWLAELSFTLHQEGSLDQARAANPEAFARLVTFAGSADSPIAALVSGAVRLSKEAAMIEQARATAGDAVNEKRIRGALHYSRTALGLVPVAEQAMVMRDEFPWITPDLLAECLELGATANEWQLKDEESLRMGASKPVPKPKHNWPMPRSAFAARFWSDPKNWIPEAGARWCDLPDGHPMKYPLDMPTSVVPAPEQ